MLAMSEKVELFIPGKLALMIGFKNELRISCTPSLRSMRQRMRKVWI